MATSENRRTVIVLVLLGVLCVLVYTLGLAAGARRGGWTPPTASTGGFPKAGKLTAGDLRVATGSCQPRQSPIAFQGECTFDVERNGGLFAVTNVVRRGKLLAVVGPVDVTATVQGHDITTNLGTGESVRLTFGKDGGRLVLTCPAPGLTQCQVELVAETS